ncbi:MAG: serine/threonine-protein kinase [Planctomycetota bacterium]
MTQDSLVGSRVGRYVIEQLLGTGGMGAVYRATQDQPRRQVALKVIRAGIVSRAALRRFEHEAEILGSLHHPGIAQVYEAGTHEWPGGRAGDARTPYFAMELLEGATTIVDHARTRQLDLRARLELFLDACDAVQCAHQKGVIHRDLKPGNLLVTREGAIKVIDFGIARAMDGDPSTATGHGEIVGTLRYMSPEQSSGDPGAVDTRSDVYSLGVVLYELLTGRLPYDIRSTSILEAARMIRDAEPPRPSVVDRRLPGDLDAIALKALEKVSARRYQTAGDLAADLRRHLCDQPILARAPSASYQLAKFARRNKVLVGGVASVTLALVLGTFATLWQARQARVERDQARAAKVESDRARDAEAAARHKAETQAEIARQVVAFLEETMQGSDPAESRGRDVPVSELLDRAAARIASAFSNQPLVAAGVQSMIGRAYYSVGRFDAAEPQLRAALASRMELLGEDDPDTILALGNLAALLWRKGDFTEALSAMRRSVQLYQKNLGPNAKETLTTSGNLAVLLESSGAFEEAESIGRATTSRLAETLGEKDPQTLMAMSNLAHIREKQRGFAEAEALYRAVLAAQRESSGDDSPDTLTTLANLVELLIDVNRLDEAETLGREALATRRRILPAGHIQIGESLTALAKILGKRGDSTRAEPLLREALAIHQAALPAGSVWTALIERWLGQCLMQLPGRLDEAEEHLLSAYDVIAESTDHSA